MIGFMLLLTTVMRFGPPGHWLDAPTPVLGWDGPNTTLPTAPTQKLEYPDMPCPGRHAATASDRAVIAAGWQLIGANQQFDGTELIFGTANFDGMCRPDFYQGFVFSNGKFVGTLSPNLMQSRSDGALNYFTSVLSATDRFSATYARYNDKDASCCPHAETTIDFFVRNGALSVEDASTTTSTAAK